MLQAVAEIGGGADLDRGGIPEVQIGGELDVVNHVERFVPAGEGDGGAARMGQID